MAPRRLWLMLDRQTGPPCVDAPRSRSDWMVGFPGSRPSCSIQRLSVEKPTQISAATCLRSKLLVSAIRTAAARKTGVGFCTKMFLLCSTIPSQRSGTMPQKVHSWPFYHLIILNDLSPLSFHLTSITKSRCRQKLALGKGEFVNLHKHICARISDLSKLFQNRFFD